jgi:hypothetical protein
MSDPWEQKKNQEHLDEREYERIPTQELNNNKMMRLMRTRDD